MTATGIYAPSKQKRERCEDSVYSRTHAVPFLFFSFLARFFSLSSSSLSIARNSATEGIAEDDKPASRVVFGSSVSSVSFGLCGGGVGGLAGKELGSGSESLNQLRLTGGAEDGVCEVSLGGLSPSASLSSP
jgi:hypothetical protein